MKAVLFYRAKNSARLTWAEPLQNASRTKSPAQRPGSELNRSVSCHFGAALSLAANLAGLVMLGSRQNNMAESRARREGRYSVSNLDRRGG